MARNRHRHHHHHHRHQDKPAAQPQGQKPQASSASAPKKIAGVSHRGWKVVGLGVAIVSAGFYVLSLTDPAGQNWASNLCPFLILGGYATIACGIVLPEKKPEKLFSPLKI